MIDLDQAWAIVAREAKPLATERVALSDAHRRILSEAVVALVDWPPADVSAMDGYAVRDADPGPRRVVGQAFAGTGFAGTMGPGDCVRVFTGAPLPRGADRVVMQENVILDGDSVTLPAPNAGRRHIRQKASDFGTGDLLLPAGRRLDALAMVVAAGADVADVCVWRRPRVTILGTGDELVAPGTARERSGTIPESVSFGVAALVEEWGGETIQRLRLPDDLHAISGAAANAVEQSDVVVVTGGASVGERDYSKAAFAAIGLASGFTKVAVKPGKPVWFGRVGGTLVLGLPGNPTSAMVMARLLLAPLVAGMAGGDPADAAQWRTAILAEPLERCGDRETLVRAQRTGDMVRPLVNQDSAAQKALADSNCLIRQHVGSPPLVAGDVIEILDFWRAY
ncbi:MAG: molybdopterin molybdotransferase MoeA [Sphingomicrobium sp.]